MNTKTLKRSIVAFTLTALVMLSPTAALAASSKTAAGTTTKQSQTKSAYIGVSAAKKAALKHAKVAESKATFTKTKLERDDGKWVYDVEFTTSTAKYDYEIGATNGKVYEHSKKNISTAKPSKVIGESAAKKAALKHAKITESKATFTKAKLERDDGKWIYDVEFTTSTAKYEYEIGATNGKVYEHSKKNISTAKPSKVIGESAAKKAALKHAKVTESKATFTKAKLERDDGKWVYDVEFTTSTAKYEYEIGATDGKVYEHSKKNSSTAKPDKMIGLEAAKKAALKHAGFSASQVTGLKARQDLDDGIWLYEVEFRKGSVEYEYEINAKTGAILSWDSERD